MTSLDHQKPKDLMNSKYKNLLIAILTAISLAAIVFTADAQLAYNHLENKGKSTYRINNISGEFDVEYEGKIQISDDDKDIVSISPGGYFELEKSSFGASRKIKIESDGDGLSKRYFVGWSERDYEPEGRKWLAEVLPELVRTTTIAAEARVNRIYQKGGASALIRELTLLKSDYVSDKYFELTFEKPLSDQDQAQALKVAGETVNSDHYLSQILSNYLKKYGVSSATVNNFIMAAGEISSDHYKTNVLLDVMKSSQIKEAQLTQLIAASNDIGSDHYKSSLLMEVLKRKDLTSTQLNEVLNQGSDIGSDHYLSNVLMEVIRTQELSTANVTNIIRATNDIGSDHYKTNVFDQLFSHASLSTSDFKLVLNSVSDVNSDHYLQQTLTKLLDKPLNEEVVVEILQVASNSMNSDHYLSTVISKVMSDQKLTTRVMDEVSSAISSLNSAHYSTEIIKSASRKDLTKSQVLALLSAVSEINSDHYFTESLVFLSDHVNRMDDEVKDAYRAAAKNISSDTYYGRAMKALDY